jgi:DNA modification methylase
MARPMRNNSAAGDIVVDAFLGSGTSIIAAEQLGRACYGMELDPNYCLMIMDRYLKYCKDKNIPCEIKLNGEHYNPSFLRQ